MGKSDDLARILSGRYVKRDKGRALMSATLAPVACPSCKLETDSGFTILHPLRREPHRKIAIGCVNRVH